MKTRSYVVLAVVALLMGTGHLCADTVPSYDFNTLAPGGLAGQDGWAMSVPTWSDATVTVGPALESTHAKVVSSTPGTTGLMRDISPLAFTSEDTAVEQHFWVYAGAGSGGAATAGLRWSGVPSHYMLGGLAYDAASPTTYFRTAAGDEKLGRQLSASHWYEFKTVMDFSQGGGVATLYTRDVTAGATTFIQDTTIGTEGSIALGLTPTDGVYTANGLAFRLDSYGSSVTALNFSAVDPNIVPEPSALILLSMGLIGILAYAWRRRK
jgi:hypothetical protein